MQKKSRVHYRNKLSEIELTAAQLSQTNYTLNCLVASLSTVVIAWEDYFINAEHYDLHPYDKAENLFGDFLNYLQILLSQDRYISDFEFPQAQQYLSKNMEDSHQALFQELWTKYSEDDYKQRISDYIYRINLNGLSDLISGSNCIDFGCGHGNFAQALIQSGAKSVLGIDYGAASIDFASKAADHIGASNIQFKVASVYDSCQESGVYDFAIQNGVFHHLDDEDKAYIEVNRVLREGGYFWVYTDGINNIQGELQDTCSRIMRRWNQDSVHLALDQLDLSVGKRYHMGDTFNAIYRHTDYCSMVKRLENYGFDVVKRLKGGFNYDSDGDALQRKWSSELYGSGDIRILAKKVRSVS